MTDFPAVGKFNTDDTLNAGGLRQGLEDVLRASKEFAGASAAVLHQIGVTGAMPADTITPASAQPSMIKLQPQTGNDDDLLRIIQTNTRDGQLLYLRINSDSYNVKLKTGGASPGNLLLLYGESEYLLSDLSQVSCFERQGTLWQEVIRSGIEDRHRIGDPGEIGWGHADWSAPTFPVEYYRDAAGVVAIEGRAQNSLSAIGNPNLFTLPVSYRPPNGSNTIHWDQQNNKAIRINVSSVGVVSYQGPIDGSASSNNVSIWLDGCRFRIS